MSVNVREIFIPPPGYAIVSVDYDACELRAWSQVCWWILGYSDLRDIVNNPKRCPHVEFGARLLDLEQPGATWDVKFARGYELKKTDPDAYKKMRNMAKGPNFGLPGGMRALRLMDYCRLGYQVDLSLEKAEKAVETWETMYRESKPYLAWVQEQIGRKRGSRGQVEFFVSKFVRGDVGYTDACNGYFQALAAHIAKTAGWRLAREAYCASHRSPLYGSRPAAFVHDEWLYFVPLERLHEAGYRMAEIMTKTAMEICPDVLFTAAPAAMFRWSKKAGDPCHNANGTLIPYEISKGLAVPANQEQHLYKLAA